MGIDELKHHYRVIEMLTTSYSALRDRYKSYALFLDISLIFASIVLCAATFFDPKITSVVGIKPSDIQIIIGVSSIIVFFISLVGQRIDWKQQSELFNQAAGILINLKNDCRILLKDDSCANIDKINEQCKTCAWTMNTLPKIPEREFLKLKALHKRKIELSKLIDKNPGSHILALRIKLFFCSNFNIKPLNESGEIKDANKS